MALNLNTLVSGLTGALQGKNQSDQSIFDVAREQEQSDFERALRLAMEKRRQKEAGRRDVLFEQGQGDRLEGRENALFESQQQQEENRIRGNAIQRFSESQGFSPEQSRDFQLGGGGISNIGAFRPKTEKPPKPPITALQRKNLIDERLDTQFSDVLDRSGLAFSKDSNVSDVFGRAIAKTGDRFDFGTGVRDVPPESTPEGSRLQALLQELLQIGSPGNRAATNDTLPELFPELFGGVSGGQAGAPLPGRQSAQPSDTVSVEEALAELRRRAGAK